MTQQIIQDIKRHGIITAAVIHKLYIDELLWLEKQEAGK